MLAGRFSLVVTPLLYPNGVIRDLAYGFRTMRKARLLSIAVTLTLAIGIGINAGVFTIINGILFRPRTNAEPATFARLYGQYWSQGSPREFAGTFSRAAYRAIRRRSESLAELAAWRADRVLIGEESTGTLAMEVSCNFFSVYRLKDPFLGRLFRASECEPETAEKVRTGDPLRLRRLWL